jgi:hydroxypyruvate isomerase
VELSFCLETLYTDQSFLERLATAQNDGIEMIEIWNWRDKNEQDFKNALQDHKLVLSNLSGNRRYGMINPDEQSLFLHEIEQSARFAKQMSCPRMMLLVQTLSENGNAVLPPHACVHHWMDLVFKTAEKAVLLADRLGLDLLIEPLNSHKDHPDYLLSSSALTFQIIQKINHPRLKVLYDIYHMSAMGEDVCRDIKDHLKDIGYFHLADLPGRTEPGSGCIPFETIVKLLKDENYSGILGFEFYPSNLQNRDIVQKTISMFQRWINS